MKIWRLKSVSYKDGIKKTDYVNTKTGEIQSYSSTPETRRIYKSGLKKGRKNMFKYLYETGGLSRQKCQEIEDFKKLHSRKK